jgi:hypothetical protein
MFAYRHEMTKQVLESANGNHEEAV